MPSSTSNVVDRIVAGISQMYTEPRERGGEWEPVNMRDLVEHVLHQAWGGARCGGSGELIENLTPHLDHRDPAHEVREFECPGCPDCLPALVDELERLRQENRRLREGLTECPYCHGTGEDFVDGTEPPVKDRCFTCGGRGLVPADTPVGRRDA